jgi:hypothetical protein
LVAVVLQTRAVLILLLWGLRQLVVIKVMEQIVPRLVALAVAPGHSTGRKVRVRLVKGMTVVRLHKMRVLVVAVLAPLVEALRPQPLQVMVVMVFLLQ